MKTLQLLHHIFRSSLLGILICSMIGLMQESFAQSFQDITPIPVVPIEYDVTHASVAVGDYNNDGSMDLYIAGRDYTGKTVAFICQYQSGLYLPDSTASANLIPLAHGHAEFGDYDNDGFLDLLAIGEDSLGVFHTKLYHNDGNGGFQLSSTNFPGIRHGEVSWGDLDNDGRLDFAISGQDSVSDKSKRFWQDRNGIFNDLYTSLMLAQKSESSLAWIDYNQDNYLDLFWTGKDLPIQTTFTLLRSNRGFIDGGHIRMYAPNDPALYDCSWSFADFDQDGDLDILASGVDMINGIPATYQYQMAGFNSLQGPIYTAIPNPVQVRGGSVQWGDYNDDGLPDYVVAGKDVNGDLQGWLYAGNGNGSNYPFYIDTLSSPIIHGTDSGSVVWVDFDTDGKLDLLAFGEDAGGGPFFRMYQNIDPSPNSIPFIPTNLQSMVQSDGAVLLSWDDAANPIGLSHNVYIGTSPGSTDILGPMADLMSGQRRINHLGNAGIDRSLLIAGLDTGTYYWSVQSIGHDYDGSPFAAEASFYHVPSRPVYPGDANFDQVVNAQDLLPIGVNFAIFGPLRPGASLDWVGQPSLAWFDSLSNGVDLKHVDTDGDGWILEDDTLAIIQNYGLTHTASKSSSVSGIPLHFSDFPSTVNPGDTLELDIFLGTADTIAMDMYGIAFSISYDTSLVEPGSIEVQYDMSWLGTKGVDLMTLSKDLFPQGQVDMALVRNDQMNQSGYGKIASIIIVMDDDISKREIPLVLDFQQILAIDSAEVNLPINGQSGSTLVDIGTTGIESWNPSDIAVYPNPISLSASTHLTLENKNLALHSAQLIDLQGKVMRSWTLANMDTHQLALTNLSPGVYILHIEGQKGMNDRKICLMP